MKIISIDSKNWINLECKGDKDYSPFKLGVSINIEHGTFNGKNIDIHFLNFEDFVKNLDAFITDRKIAPILNGTYDSYIKFEGRKNNSIFICFNVGDAYAGYSQTVDFSLKGEFEINSEYLNNFYEDFKRLEKNA